jgi:hypothetical protein
MMGDCYASKHVRWIVWIDPKIGQVDSTCVDKKNLTFAVSIFFQFYFYQECQALAASQMVSQSSVSRLPNT